MTDQPGHTPAFSIQQPEPGDEPFRLQQMAPRRRVNRPLIGVIVLVVILAGAGAAWFGLHHGLRNPVVAASFVIGGSLDLTSASVGNDRTTCWGTDGYDDIRHGTQVTVTDPGGKVVALGALDSGTLAGSIVECVFRFTVEDVPGGLGFYGLEVSHRGVVRYAEADLRHNHVTLTLG